MVFASHIHLLSLQGALAGCDRLAAEKTAAARRCSAASAIAKILKRERYHQLVKQTRPVVLQSTEELPVKSQDKIEPIVQDGENALKLQPFSSAFQTKDAKG